MNRQVSKAFKTLYFRKRTGVLTCEAESTRRAVYFRSGFVVGASSSAKHDRLGEVMMRHGRITPEQFEEASRYIKSGWKLGEILAELKLIGEAEIEAFVRLQLLDITCTQLLNPPKRLSFSPLTDVDVWLAAPLSVADILMEAARRSPEPDRMLASLKSEERKLGFPKDPAKRFQDVTLKPEEAFVLSRVDGTQTVADVFSVSPLPEEETARIVKGLLESEVIVFEDIEEGGASQDAVTAPEPAESPRVAVAPAHHSATVAPVDTELTMRSGEESDRDRTSVELLYQQVQFKDHWEVLGIERGASADEVKQAFLDGAKRYHPDRYRRITEPEFQEKLSFVFRRINEAFETLSSPEAKSQYESLLERETEYSEQGQSMGLSDSDVSAKDRAEKAAELHQKAKRAFDTEEFWTCIEMSRQCVDLAPDVASYYNLLGLALAKNPKWRQDAERNLSIAANLDPFRASYVLDLAKLYEQGGLHLRAQRTLEKARAIDPTVGGPSSEP